MALQLYNTMTRKKEAFTPADPSRVTMYVCGPTVYDLAHVGNARPVVVFDVLYRLLKRLYPRVVYARNITDIDDKIIDAAKERGEDIAALTARTEKAFHDDMAALGALPPDIEPHATKHIEDMKALIETLIASGHAYAAEGHVLFQVSTMKGYGRLSRHSRDELIAGARVEVAPYKRDAADFVLWKPSTAEQPGWDSPWGRGRPGWHLECSAMSEKHLGLPIDIHGGGQDLIFPHHENEIAQSVCAHGGDEFVRTWVHNGHVMVEGEKMSKSLGNFYTVRQLLDEGWHGEVIRLVLLKTHYRAPLNFSRDALKEAKAELDRLYRAMERLKDVHSKRPKSPLPFIIPNEGPMDRLGDDLNTPFAISVLHEYALVVFNPGMILRPALDLGEVKYEMEQRAALLGLLQHDPVAWFKRPNIRTLRGDLVIGEFTSSGEIHVGTDEEREIERMIAERNEARKQRNFAEADRIRDKLKSKGIILEDHPGSATDWRRE